MTKCNNQNRLVSVFDDPPRSNVLLLSCMDQRLLDDTVRFMNELNLQNRYDQVALAGGAMGALRLLDPNLPPAKRWQGVFEAHLATAINVLHRPIKDVFLLDHLDCGAYKYLHPDTNIRAEYREANLCQMVPLHQNELKNFACEVKKFIASESKKAEDEFNNIHSACDSNEPYKEGGKKCWDYVSKLASEKVEAWQNIRVSYFVMDLLGKVKQLDVPSGQNDTFP